MCTCACVRVMRLSYKCGDATFTFGYGHTWYKVPDPIRTRKSNYHGRRQYCGGGPRGNTACRNLFAVFLFARPFQVLFFFLRFFYAFAHYGVCACMCICGRACVSLHRIFKQARRPRRTTKHLSGERPGALQTRRRRYESTAESMRDTVRPKCPKGQGD